MHIAQLLVYRRIFVDIFMRMREMLGGKKTNEMAGCNETTSILKRISGRNTRYISTLTHEDQRRYREKLNICVGDKIEAIQSPYEIWDDKKRWSDSPVFWPHICWGDIYSYLIESPGPFTHDKLKAFKSLEAYDYFVSRKVGPVSSTKQKDVVVLKAEVRPGQAESQRDSHLPWVIAKESGEIITAHCDCKAGLGETCSHVAALMFKVEAPVRIGLATAECTSEACRWNQVFGNNSLTAPVEEINFHPSKKEETAPRPACEKKGRIPLACIRGDEGYMEAYSGYISELKDICPTACIFKSLPRLDPEETDTANSEINDSEDEDMDILAHQVLVAPRQKPQLSHLHAKDSPGPPPFPFSGTRLQKWEETPQKTSDQHKVYIHSLSVTYEQANELQKQTKQQADCPKWFLLKHSRLTASNFGKICKKMSSKKAKPELVARDLLHPKPPTDFQKKMLTWGKENENIAIQVYKGLAQRSHVTVHECGLYISPEDPILAATPDRVCYDSTENIKWGVIEVKCPYSAREKTPTEAAKSKKFMSKLHDGALQLKHDHEYYYQVQGQMAITGAQWCDFVIYTKAGIAIERIPFNHQFWISAACRLHDFFYSYFLPMFIVSQESAK